MHIHTYKGDTVLRHNTFPTPPSPPLYFLGLACNMINWWYANENNRYTHLFCCVVLSLSLFLSCFLCLYQLIPVYLLQIDWWEMGEMGVGKQRERNMVMRQYRAVAEYRNLSNTHAHTNIHTHTHTTLKRWSQSWTGWLTRNFSAWRTLSVYFGEREQTATKKSRPKKGTGVSLYSASALSKGIKEGRI